MFTKFSQQNLYNKTLLISKKSDVSIELILELIIIYYLGFVWNYCKNVINVALLLYFFAKY